MSKVIVTGVTGNAGSAVLTAAIASPTISSIAVLSRKPPFETSSKIKFIQLPSSEYPKGFDEIPTSLIDDLKKEGYLSCIWALGISQTQVKKDEYIKITHNYTLTAAKAFSTIGTKDKPFRFIFMSGEGARQDEKGYAIFSKIKGRTEKDLLEFSEKNQGFEVASIRPGGIMPTAEHLPRQGFLMRSASRVFGSVFGVVMPSMIIPASELAVACVGLAQGKGWDQRDHQGVIENATLRQMAQDWI
ncbi:uncharacterized protein IL334_006624 [Kwoniella shivajii]|uniref:NAD(P)-binding domain-containing protein n=1 Tax=Kwoniella shivajii TaxID=564305 RepID=A0ABZ1D8E4_9TREE|nr:hypothetical protein IL334_006624 [Kwoniella shivajii]